MTQEIQSAEFKDYEEWTGSGYILDINKDERKVDVQFYEKLPEGRYIATLLVPKELDMETLELAVVYMFKFMASKATLSDKVVTFLKEKYSLDMSNIYEFKLQSVEKLDAEADASAGSRKSAEGDEEADEEE